jgi:negative regulator of replication initiation
MPRKMRRQVHAWLDNSDYQWLSSEAQAHDETISGALRRLFKAERARQRAMQVTPRLRVIASLHKK